MNKIQFLLSVIAVLILVSCKNTAEVSAVNTTERPKTIAPAAAKKEESKKVAPKIVPSKTLKKDEPKLEDM